MLDLHCHSTAQGQISLLPGCLMCRDKTDITSHLIEALLCQYTGHCSNCVAASISFYIERDTTEHKRGVMVISFSPKSI